MIFHETGLADARLIEQERHVDDRGHFARVACAGEFARAGIEADYPQASVSHNTRAGTLRGMHFQRPPHAEAKVVRATRGAVFDVIIDLRPGSPTFRRWQGFELSAGNGRMLYIPKGFAHGFQTLEDETDVLYLITPAFVPGHGDGVRFDDPAFAIDWPLPVSVIAEKDRIWPLFGG
ncbi:dTDP-4-dehydrorhamnose 3,5-epimerase [Amaricoccus solimangrovi]|uniref:dTDP-4-dehydrorhamnose 3,5-epimerase n=1 Tax=Amaricoccus solimangrovi TaxID=2589815 RepID=A0A501WRL3_9RHOB|nr:dTDP-4-dehydrorhamnose 3,5-epimerase [Amaricoccus solimangrovi]TPE48406.1 dTDP-4-dehydrorhamnose 3,5-epimerase [Amaricoccus solimangrovi]